MILNVSVEEVLTKVGHDGSQILWPTLPEPVRRKAFHIEEMQYVCLDYGVALAPYYDGIDYQNSHIIKFDLNKILARFDGILLGRGSSGRRHAVAWNKAEKVIYDPAGVKIGAESFTIETFYAAIRHRVF